MKNTIFKLMPTAALCAALALASCAEDKGNYTYSEENTITIDNIPTLTSVLANAEYVDLKPVVTSSIDGDVKADNSNYSFVYMRKNSDGKWVKLGDQKDLHILAEMSAGTNNCYFAVTDNRTGVQTIKPFDVRATTITSEGWLVLCDEGSDEKVRMDMLSQISLDRIMPAYNVLPAADDVPPMYHATKIGYVRTYGGFSSIFMFSKTDAYVVPTADANAYGELGELTLADEFKANQFLTKTSDHIINHVTVPYMTYGRPNAAICVSSEGNAYAYNYNSTNMSAAFEYPINTSTRGADPEYKVSPYVGVTDLRFDALGDYGCALLYDTDHKRFVGWSSKGAATNDPAGLTQKCTPLTDPTDGKKFSYQTGMDLVCMINTAQSSGTVYCVMKDGNKRHVYAISVLTDEFKQLDAYNDIQAPDFDKATCYAASSQYAVIYYAYKNKVYSYNLATKASTEMDLPSNEEVTMLKFNRYDEPWGTGSYISQSFLGKLDAATKQIYLDRQNDLIVGSYDSTVQGNDGGVLRFYNVGDGGQNLTLKKDKAGDADRTWEYKGFARIVDVRYKEVK